MKTEKSKEIHEVYERCKEVFKPTLELRHEYLNLEEEEEKEFFLLVADFFLQKGQLKIIKEEAQYYANSRRR